nr:MAG TPA: protein of unknown function (UPF0154) [Caudoviricetes sp.]
MNKEFVKGLCGVTLCLTLFAGGIGLGFFIGRSQATRVAYNENTNNMTIQEMMSEMYRNNPTEAIEFAFSADGEPDVINSDYEAYLKTIIRMEEMRDALNMGAKFEDVGIPWTK